jgi:osmotically-inducible protein OsmY
MARDRAILPSPGGRMRQVGTTQDVREAVEKELSFDPMVDAKKITVRNIDRDVTLTGTVPSYRRPKRSGRRRGWFR